MVIDCQLYATGSHAVATGRLVFRPDVLRLAASANPSTSSTGRIGTFGLTAVGTPAPPSSTEHEPD